LKLREIILILRGAMADRCKPTPKAS
jgi:hypothetical protein